MNTVLSRMHYFGLSEKILETKNLIDIRIYNIIERLLNINIYPKFIKEYLQYYISIINTLSFFEINRTIENPKTIVQTNQWLNRFQNLIFTFREIERILWMFEESFKQRDKTHSYYGNYINIPLSTDGYALSVLKKLNNSICFNNSLPLIISFSVREEEPTIFKGFTSDMACYLNDLPPVFFLKVQKHHYYHSRLIPYIAHEVMHTFVSHYPADILFSDIVNNQDIASFNDITFRLEPTTEEIIVDSENNTGNVREILMNENFYNILKIICSHLDCRTLSKKIEAAVEMICDILAEMVAGPSYLFSLLSSGGIYNDSIEINAYKRSFLRIYLLAKILEFMEYDNIPVGDNNFIAIPEMFGNKFYEKYESLNLDGNLRWLYNHLLIYINENSGLYNREKWEMIMDSVDILENSNEILMDDPIDILNIIWAKRIKDALTINANTRFFLSEVSIDNPRHALIVIDKLVEYFNNNIRIYEQYLR